MSNLEIELQDLREKNNELVKSIQYWKMTAAQRENEKLELLKENNDLRLQLSRLRSGGAAHARKLDAEIQSASKEALSHLVQASSAVTRTVQLTKTYMQEKQKMEMALPRWSSISNTPSSEKVHRVLPMLIGGQSIQPVVSLSRTMVNVNNTRTNRSPSNQSHNFSERGPLPMHMLQDLYIPLTRIDANGLPVNSMDVDTGEEGGDGNNSAEDLGLNDSSDQSLRESPNASDTDEFEDTRRLDVVEEDLEPEDAVQPSPKPRIENPLEGPSWMLDRQSKGHKSKVRVNLEPDSTTECDEPPGCSRGAAASRLHAEPERARLSPAVGAPCEFSPTVRRRKRTSSPPAARTPLTPHTPHTYSPRPAARRNSNNGRILKVLVSKLRLDEDDVSPPKRPFLHNSPSRPGRSPGRGSPDRRDSSPATSPTKRHPRDKSPSLRLSRDMQLLSFDAPSPNGATSHVVISESTAPLDTGGSGEPAPVARRISKQDSRVSRDTKQESRTSRDTKHESCTSRDTKHDNRTSRDTKHESSASRDTKHESSTSRDTKRDNLTSRDTKHDSCVSSETKYDSRGSHDSDSGSDVPPEGRTRRPRKAVVYKEKPLNRKMRR